MRRPHAPGVSLTRAAQGQEPAHVFLRAVGL